jgi:hypothetical protein
MGIGTRMGIMAQSGGGFANALSLAVDGSSDRASIPSWTTFDGLDKFSISAWVKMPSGGGGGFMGQNNTASYNSQRFKYILSLTSVQTYVNNIAFSANLSLNADQWYHVVAIFDRTLSGNLNKCRFIVNNVEVSNTNGSNWAAKSSDSDPLTIGTIMRGTSSPIVLSAFEGNIDEVSMWNVALTDSNVISIYNSGTPNDVSSLGISGLVNWWRMGDTDGVSSTTLTDVGSGGDDGTLINSAAYEADTP